MTARKRRKEGMMPKLTEGTKAPDFRLLKDGGGAVSLADFSGRTLVLYFYPKADTPGCTAEAKDFSRLMPAFKAAAIDVVGVSADPVKKQDAFKTKHGLTTPLASDETHDMLEAYGVWVEKSMYGKKYMGINRTTVLIDRNGNVARIWPKVKVGGHADEVLAAAKAI
jgi:thioredoxin-dependent peroxiredoxin